MHYKSSELAFISFNKEHFSSSQSQFKYYFEVGDSLKDVKEDLIEEELFCSHEEKLKMREIYYLLRKCEDLDVSAIVIGWIDEKKGTLWDKIFRSTQGEEVEP